MHYSPQSYISKLSCLLFMIGLLHANDQTDQKTFNFGNHKFSGSNSQQNERNIRKEDIPPKVPQEFIKDMLSTYPRISRRIKALQIERKTRRYVPSSMLLVGKPGCGKTTMAVAIAQTLKKRKFVFCEATSLVGDSYQNSAVNFLEEKLEKIVEEMEQNPDTKYVVVLDEITRIAENLKSNRSEERSAVTKLWLIMDKFRHSKRVFFIATANEIDDLPEQIRSRFSTRNIIEVTPPNPKFRRKILLNCLGKQHKLTKEELDNLVGYTDGFTHRDISMLVEAADEIANEKDENAEFISYEALIEAIKEVKDISFLGQWIYTPTYNWVVTPTKNMLDSYAKFCERNQTTILTSAGGATLCCIIGCAVKAGFVWYTGGAGVILLDPATIVAIKGLLAANGFKAAALAGTTLTLAAAGAA